MKNTLYSTLATGTPWEDPDDTGLRPTISTNATAAHLQQANDTYIKAIRIFENSATMDEALNHQIIKTIEGTYTKELRNKYTRFTVVNMIDLVHHLMDRYGKIIEIDLKENQKRFNGAFYTTMPIDKYV